MLSAFILLFSTVLSESTDPYPRNAAIDIIHYTFNLDLNDTTNVIAGKADVSILFRQDAPEFNLNLIGKKSDGFGMKVFEVTSSGKPLTFIHHGDIVSIKSDQLFTKEDTLTFSVSYAGEPQDGLVIGKNKFGDRTFFGDNWPDRGRYWLPTLDHPYDKATVDFIIAAPDHYEVVATGKLLSAKQLSKGRTQHHWHESTPVAVKVMTIGVAEFSVQQSGIVGAIPVTTWVYPQNDTDGFKDFAVAPNVLKFLQDFIGPYPYEKLAHVQSKTRFGGLENASNIFYFENSVTGKKQIEGLIAHETAHQWFGNSVTENDWYHVWLSEGFATYFAALYMRSAHGDETFLAEMDESRGDVIKFYQKKQSSVIDTTITDINGVLNTNTYQKAAWFLHMLRARMGPDPFQKGIRSYYSRYRDGNTSTDDFKERMEAASTLDLDDFFKKWLYQPGYPHLAGTWSYNKKSKTVKIDIRHLPSFDAPAGTSVEVLVKLPQGRVVTAQYPLDIEPDRSLTIETGERPQEVILDPNTILLFEGEMHEKP
jgi:aminopeptidase N